MGGIDPVGIATELSLGVRGEGKADEATALRSFEAYFLGEMLRISAPKNPTGLFDGGEAGRMYREHFYQELARIVAENGGVGIATSLEGQLEGQLARAKSPEEETR
ncbi:MAG: rod-binding protein [Myxococcota bacterium]